MKKTKILIAAGGSGGHIFPAIALARAIKELSGSFEIMFVGTDKALDRRIFDKEGVRYSLISANKFPPGISFGIIPFLVKFKIDMIRIFFVVSGFKPDVIVGFGGYASCPAILTARLLRIPRLVHEQNAAPGRANKFLFRFSDKIALTFEQTRADKYLGSAISKSVVTGNPLRAEVLRYDRASGLKRFGLDPLKFTLLVIGGSQGAHFLNENFVNAMSGLEKSQRERFQVIHLTGVKDYDWAIKAYSAVGGLESRVFSFIDRIEEAYSACDLAVTRSGSSAIFEMACFGKPMILVPYPFAMSHQAENAGAFASRGAALVLEEKNLSAGLFKDNILRLYNDKDLMRRMGYIAKEMSVPDASMKLAKEVLGLSGR